MATKHFPLLDDLQADLIAAVNARDDFEDALKQRRAVEFKAAGGCKCGGRGWVVTWDTMDSLSGCYAEYGTCPDCDGKSTLIDRSYYSKYDRNRGMAELSLVVTPAEQAEMDRLTLAVQDTQHAYDSLKAALDPCTKGRKVRVYKGRKVPVGTVGTVFWIGAVAVRAGWKQLQQTRLGIKDDAGNTYWVNADNCESVLPTY